MVTQVNVVPHTHWDREWYLPFPVFRMRLVELVDLLLPAMSDDGGFPHFQLDGQMAAVDDYLEMRPDERGRLAALNAAGRLSMGPWYTLPDEFLVSGETLVRDLRLGLSRAEELGGAMQVGYLPDMFGHVAQMPQILAGFGFADAVVWRGVPSTVRAPAFWWEAPDGSRVRAEYLSEGYGNGAHLPRSGAELAGQVDAFREAGGPLVGEPVLWMNGTDHQLPQFHVGDLVAEADAAQDRYRFTVTSLADHLAQASRDGLPTWRGELRSSARANLLMGVASCRLDVKQAAARAERWLERVAEPLAAVWLPAGDWPAAFLDHAWRDVIRNAAHDSICGCSADEVNDAVLHRYAEATRVAEAVAERALVRALADAGAAAPVVVNPTARERSGVVAVVLGGDVPPPHTQQVSVRPARLRTETLTRRAAVPVLVRAVVDDPRASDVSLAPDPSRPGEWVASILDDGRPPARDLSELRHELDAFAAEDPDGPVHLELVRPEATQQVLVRTAAVPGFGRRGLAPDDLGAHAVRAEGAGLSNGLVTVIPHAGDGTFSVDGIDGFGRLVDGGDVGDTYNWCPPHGDVLVDRPEEVHVSVPEAGPVRGRIEIVRRYRWPSHVESGQRADLVEVEVTTEVVLHAGEDLVRVAVSVDNRCRDHRLRIHLPLPEPAAGSEAECAYASVRRGLDAEGGPNEEGVPTFPSRRFVRAGGLLVVHDGLPEYELVDVRGEGDGRRAHELAVTLLRSVGIVSQGPMTTRALPAGPPTPTPGAQMPGAHRAELVLHLGDRDPYAVADEAFTPLLVAKPIGARGFGDAADVAGRLSVSGAEVTALTRRRDGRLELRVVNPSDAPTTLVVEGRTGELTDLAGRPTGERFDGALPVPPWRIVTLALDG